jgi:Arginine kinase
MTWYNKNGNNKDVVVSSRVRFARNLADYPFAAKLDPVSAAEIIGKVKGLFDSEYNIIDFDKLSPIEARSYVEKHYVSPQFAGSPLPRCLITNDTKDLSIMVCEEDHIRLQSITSGLSLDEAFENVCEADDIICEKLNVAYDEQLGYLTHCPTNLGTGMRASVMMFLPALTATKEINRIAPQLSKFGLTIRGLYGEGSEADGCLYQISNQITLGITEEATIEKLSDIINQIITKEHQARDMIKSDNYNRLADMVYRSYGVINYAYLIDSKEFLKLYSDIRLGIAMGFINDINYETLDELMINVLPANLIRSSGKELNENERDLYRAEYIKKQLKGSR